MSVCLAAAEERVRVDFDLHEEQDGEPEQLHTGILEGSVQQSLLQTN